MIELDKYLVKNVEGITQWFIKSFLGNKKDFCEQISEKYQIQQSAFSTKNSFKKYEYSSIFILIRKFETILHVLCIWKGCQTCLKKNCGSMCPPTFVSQSHFNVSIFFLIPERKPAILILKFDS